MTTWFVLYSIKAFIVIVNIKGRIIEFTFHTFGSTFEYWI